jgi:hypothetical protein
VFWVFVFFYFSGISKKAVFQHGLLFLKKKRKVRISVRKGVGRGVAWRTRHDMCLIGVPEGVFLVDSANIWCLFCFFAFLGTRHATCVWPSVFVFSGKIFFPKFGKNRFFGQIDRFADLKTALVGVLHNMCGVHATHALFLGPILTSTKSPWDRLLPLLEYPPPALSGCVSLGRLLHAVRRGVRGRVVLRGRVFPCMCNPWACAVGDARPAMLPGGWRGVHATPIAFPFDFGGVCCVCLTWLLVFPVVHGSVFWVCSYGGRVARTPQAPDISGRNGGVFGSLVAGRKCVARFRVFFFESKILYAPHCTPK